MIKKKEMERLNLKKNFKGNFKNDKKNKFGITEFKNGKTLVGNYENDILLNGKIIYPNSEVYEGECNEDGIQIGKGKMIYNNGEIFIGNWKNNKKNGKGLLCYEINDMDLFNKKFDIIKNNIVKIFELDFRNNFYYGDFVNDIMDGKGILLMKNNENNMKDLIYEGDFKNNKKHGKGVIYFNKNLFSEIYMENDRFYHKIKLKEIVIIVKIN